MAEATRTPARSAIERMLRPRSIAIVGASPSPGSLGRKPARQSGALRVSAAISIW